ncbi:MAG: hypothetical protein KDK99_01695 [Verrucomicrobiales bacterium]|nr:hypothetical protein [Verrucomicrobiales bacterium]
MTQSRSIHLVSVILLLFWGGVLLYFYLSGRLSHYLPPDGIFRPMVLISGIGLVILGVFNFLTRNAEDIGCEGHDHGHDHDHGEGKCGHEGHSCCHGADSAPAEKTAKSCCHHGHAHEHDHAHDHHHDHAHDHDHGTCHHHEGESGHAHSHAHAGGCCGGHDHGGHDHAHGILEESSAMGRLVAVGILAVPLTLAAVMTPDRYSPNAVINKGLYNQNYASTARADQFSLKKPDAAPKPAPTAAPTVAATTPDAPPAPTPATTAAPVASAGSNAGGDAPPAAGGDAPASQDAGSATPAQSYGGFTLADLEAQVPKSSAGNFILEVPEIYYTAGDLEVQGVLKGQPVETIAQVLPEKVNNDEGHRLRIFRMLVQCCAADARPYSVPVDFGKSAPEMKDMTWVKVTGTMDYVKEGGQTVPLVRVKSMEETTEPDQSMIY